MTVALSLTPDVRFTGDQVPHVVGREGIWASRVALTAVEAFMKMKPAEQPLGWD